MGPPPPCPEAPGSRWVEEEGGGGGGEPPAGSPSRKLAMRSVFPLASGKKSHACCAVPAPGSAEPRRVWPAQGKGNSQPWFLSCLSSPVHVE